MSKRDDWYTTEPDLPIVNKYTIKALRKAYNLSPEDSARKLMRRIVEDDPKFAHQIIIEANRRSNGDMARQEAFIEGANFAREAVRQSMAINNICVLFETTGTTEAAELEEDLESSSESATA